MNLGIKLLLPLAMLVSLHLFADDGAASIAAGGLVVMGREPRIVMAKEVLQISPTKVVVDYDFRNDSDEDITTEVAFPIPAYGLAMEDAAPAQQGFEDFRLWIDGVPSQYKVEARAFLKDQEFTHLLTSMHIDIASFGHATSNDENRDIQRLTATQHKRLEEAGLVDSGENAAKWMVQKKYYWRQTFPAHKTVHIRHDYSPFVGNENSIRYGMGPDPDVAMVEELNTFCIDSQLHSVLQQIAQSKNKDASYSYVDFILTTANTWKTPIEDFTLIVERPHSKGSLTDYVSFCWDGPVTKIDAGHFSAKATNLVPKKELRVGFFVPEHKVF